ncbi:MAG: fructosamine kinase family protein, partial [Verrucomicrobiota bacterium]
FVKQNRRESLPLFKAEKAALELLHSSGTIRVPEPYLTSICGAQSFFAMEGLNLTSSSSSASQKDLGERLAALHEVKAPDNLFGATFDNYIGATPQSNRQHSEWADFFIEERLQPQFRFAEARGKRFAREEELLSEVHSHLATLSVAPSLLHGDLWGGNVGFLDTSEPVLFDPASYYGDRETDLAFTKMFGGFSPAFYEAYRSIHPELEPVREVIYNLYHLLNHFHLFGGGYAMQADSSIDEILRRR